MVLVFSKEDAVKKAEYYGWRCNNIHSFGIKEYGDGFAVVQTDCDEPFYLGKHGFFQING